MAHTFIVFCLNVEPFSLCYKTQWLVLLRDDKVYMDPLGYLQKYSQMNKVIIDILGLDTRGYLSVNILHGYECK